MTWAKKQADGQVSWGDRITGPGFTLTSAADQPADGWEWLGTLEADAAARFKLADVVTEADGWALGDELLEFGAWVVTDGLPVAA